MIFAIVTSSMAGPPVPSPIGSVPNIIAQRVCAADNVSIGEIVSVNSYMQPITSGGEHVYDIAHTRIDFRILRHLRGEEKRLTTLTVRGAPPSSDNPVGSISETSIRPHVGWVYAIAYTRLKNDSPTWPEGTPVIYGHALIESGSDGDLPSSSHLAAQLEQFCACLE